MSNGQPIEFDTGRASWGTLRSQVTFTRNEIDCYRGDIDNIADQDLTRILASHLKLIMSVQIVPMQGGGRRYESAVVVADNKETHAALHQYRVQEDLDLVNGLGRSFLLMKIQSSKYGTREEIGYKQAMKEVTEEIARTRTKLVSQLEAAAT